MRWEREPGEIVGLFAATARPTLWLRVRGILLGLLVGLVCAILVASPLLLVR